MSPLSNEIFAVSEPQVDLDPKQTEALLSKELMQLTFQDRNDITEEIHGVQSLAVHESSYTRDEGLTKLQYKIDSLPPSEKEAYSLAQTLPVTYVNDSAFRLRFLRADFFDAGEAAKRMMSYLDLVLELFGIEALKRPLRTTDFKTKEEKSCLKGGLVQLLPYRDRSGRRVMVILSDIMSQNHYMRVRCAYAAIIVYASCCS